MTHYLSPAKLNLFFRVLNKRPDGYHSIASIYQAIDLADHITLSDAPSDRLTCTDPNLPCDASNLAYKALQLFRSHYECPNVHIHLDKRIPMQSGLGGGSSNAATVLWALNQRAGRRASLGAIQSMGAQIGSDVAFFLSLGTAYCTGRGEILEPIRHMFIEGCLAKPSYGLSTPLVYRETKIGELDPVDPEQVLKSYQAGVPLYFNDLEKAAFRIEPRLVHFKEQLQKNGFRYVCMTGSGTAFFCLGGDSSTANGGRLKAPDKINSSAYPPLKGRDCASSRLFNDLPFRSIQRTAETWYCIPR
ncbi:MAG: 4-diphosphocytidyl-2-C-methyl-D-erythritol kinase [Parachlamydiales bacterium]|nr:4-diphosphocytidyl-2-C-methyl-D-erythritol kinase [Parachlamydiales bacterium]